MTMAFLFQPGALTTQAYRPVANIQWGIFNIRSQPVFKVKETTGYSYGQGNYVIREYGFTPNTNWYIFNPALTITSVKTAKVYETANPSAFVSSIPYYGTSPQVWYQNLGNVYGTYPQVSAKFAVEITIKNSQAKYYDDEIVIYKVFPIIKPLYY